MFARTVRLHVRNERRKGKCGNPMQQKKSEDAAMTFDVIFCKRATL